MILWTSCRRISTCETVSSTCTVRVKKHITTEWQVTFPLISCSTMFSGLRSLWMILFSCRYWIPEPGAEGGGFTERKRHVWHEHAARGANAGHTDIVEQRQHFTLFQTATVFRFAQHLEATQTQICHRCSESMGWRPNLIICTAVVGKKQISHKQYGTVKHPKQLQGIFFRATDRCLTDNSRDITRLTRIFKNPTGSRTNHLSDWGKLIWKSWSAAAPRSWLNL